MHLFMKIKELYVLVNYWYDGFEILGVFQSLSEAREAEGIAIAKYGDSLNNLVLIKAPFGKVQNPKNSKIIDDLTGGLDF